MVKMRTSQHDSACTGTDMRCNTRIMMKRLVKWFDVLSDHDHTQFRVSSKHPRVLLSTENPGLVPKSPSSHV